MRKHILSVIICEQLLSFEHRMFQGKQLSSCVWILYLFSNTHPKWKHYYTMGNVKFDMFFSPLCAYLQWLSNKPIYGSNSSLMAEHHSTLLSR